MLEELQYGELILLVRGAPLWQVGPIVRGAPIWRVGPIDKRSSYIGSSALLRGFLLDFFQKWTLKFSIPVFVYKSVNFIQIIVQEKFILIKSIISL